MGVIGKVRGCDRGSLGLAVTALFALGTALAAAPHSGHPAVPERLLDRVRGANPNWWRVGNPNGANCSAWNVYVCNSAGYNYVTYYGCTAAGQTCISCALQNNYVVTQNPAVNNCNPKPIQAVNCNNASGNGSIGTCNAGSMCVLTGNFDCDQYAANFTLE